MKIKKIKFSNFRLFENLEIDFPDSNFIVLIGNNGAGKTSILDGIALCFTHLTGELISKNENYGIDSWFLNDDITIGQNDGKIDITFEYSFINDNTRKIISIENSRKESGFKFDKKPYGFVAKIKDLIKRNKLNSIPIIAYYNVNRTLTSKGEQKEISTYDEKLYAYAKTLNINSPIFEDFEQWFLKQEIKENALKVSKGDLSLYLPSLKIVQTALKKYLNAIGIENYNKVNILRESEIDSSFTENTKEFLSFNKHDIEFKFKQLSSGEKMIILLVVDIARRLTIANENNENALEGEGIVLIDELELHLHPNWQLKIVKALKTTFPNVQFFATTHSPLIISGMRREEILVLNHGELIPSEGLPNIYSGTADQILEDIMFADNKIDLFADEKKEIDILFNKMDFDGAEIKLAELKKKVAASPKWLKDYERRISFAKA